VTIEPLIRCTIEEEQRPLFESLDHDTAERLETLWRERLRGLRTADLVYRQGVAYVSGLC
jgi:hypothetical protein